MNPRVPLLLALLLAASTQARTTRVLPGPGSPLADAVRSAAEDDVLVIAPGLYRERVVIDKRIALLGEPGARIDASEDFPGEWSAAPEIGPDVWRRSAPKEVRGLLIDGRFLAALNEKRVQIPGAWNGTNLLRVGPPLSGFREIRGLFLWNEAERTIAVTLGGDDPARHAWRQVLQAEAVVTFRDVTGARVSGLVLSGGFYGVRFVNAKDCRLEGVEIASYENVGVVIGDGSSGCLVANCRITRGSWESWASKEITSGAERKAEYETWQIHKRAGFYDRMGINVFRAGSSNRILSNRLIQTFDGIDIGDYAIESLSKPMENPEHGAGTEIAWNLIQDVRDSGLEIGAGAIDVHIHHNRLLRTHGGLRFKLPRVGPLFIHHNWLEDDRGFNVWFSMDSSPAVGYVFHNTIVGTTAALQYSSMEKGFEKSGTPNWRFVNNLVVCSNGFFTNRQKNGFAPNFKADHNVIAGGASPWPDDPGREIGSRYLPTLALPSSLGLPPGSPASGVATDLSRAHADGPLPGWNETSEVGAGPLPDFLKSE